MLKRGVGSQKQAKVIVIVENKAADKMLLDYWEKSPETAAEKVKRLSGKAKGKSVEKVVHYIKLLVINDLTAKTIDDIVRKHVVKDTVIITDSSTSHNNFADYFTEHIAVTESENVDEVVKSTLPWVHIVIGRCRDGIAAIHGDVDAQFLQLYLNEFCWKFNRSFFRVSTDPKYDLFNRLANIAAKYTSNIKWRNQVQPDDYDFD